MSAECTQKQSRSSGLQPKTDPQTVDKIFFDLEKKFNLFDLRVNQVPIWERLRFRIHRKILVGSGIIAQPHSKAVQSGSRIGNYRRIVKEVVYPTYRNMRRADILFFGHHRRKKMQDGKWWDLYCDPIINALDRSYEYVESPYLGGHLTPARTESMTYLDNLILRGTLLVDVRAKYLKIDPEVIDTLRSVRREIHHRFAVDIDLVQMTRKVIALRQGLLPLYIRLLDAVRPRLVVVVVSYGKESFIEACKVKQIPVVELQHGIATPQHVAYSFPAPHQKKQTFPDYFFTFGDYWKTSVEYPIPKSQVIPVGFPYFEMESSRVTKNRRQKQVVFLSQGTVGKEMSRMAVDLRRQLSNEWTVIYKLHPGEYNRWQTLYPWLFGTDIIVIGDDSVPLYDLLAQSLVLVGVSSTAIFEGLGLGSGAIILDLPGSENLRGLIDRGHAKIVDNAADLADLVKTTKRASIPSEEFFKPKGLENVKTELEHIIRKRTAALNVQTFDD